MKTFPEFIIPTLVSWALRFQKLLNKVKKIISSVSEVNRGTVKQMSCSGEESHVGGGWGEDRGGLYECLKDAAG